MGEGREQVDALDRVAVEQVKTQRLVLGSVRAAAARLSACGWDVSMMGAQRLLDGSRRSLTVGEWLHVAYALSVPPIGLVAPQNGRFRVGRDRNVSATALESWITGASPLPRMTDGTPGDAAERLNRYLDAARERRPATGTRLGGYLRRTADAYDRASAPEREGILLDLLQHLVGVELRAFGQRRKPSTTK